MKICKASPLGAAPIPDVMLDISETLPSDFGSVGAANFYKSEARALMDGLSVLPQGTRHQLLLLMLESASVLYRGR
jgi:hypothetical protein